MNIDEENITMSGCLADDYGMNSISFVKLIINVEKEFNIQVPDEYFTLIEIDTLQKLLEIINMLKK